MTRSGSFIEDLAETHPRITLIGMSGLGKSHWSKVLSQKGFKRFCCDNMIAERLFDNCQDPEGAIGCLGQWMGLPFDTDFVKREEQYLSMETEVLSTIIDVLEAADPNEKIVIDTTGSAPYSGKVVMQRLKRLTHMVHLAISDAVVPQMLDRYLQSPRPVLWRGLFSRKPFESDQAALERSYNALLTHREALYRQYAHISVSYEVHHID